ncbi:MAG: tol-pal system protein YbgF [Mariprofundaceae bacterium]
MIWRPSVFPVAAFSLCLLFSGCVTEPKKTSDSWAADKPIVLQSIAELRLQKDELAEGLKALQRHVSEVATSNTQHHDALHAAHQKEIGNLKKQIRRLQIATTRLKTTTTRLKKSGQISQISKQKLDKKIEKIAQAIKPVEATDQAVGGEEEKDHYTAAYLALKSGRYDEAIEKFRSLLKVYPEGQYSDQAYYWLGESYLVMNNTGRAIGNFEWLISHHPESSKHAVAMLKLGLAYQSQKRADESKSIWQKLIEMHADSPAAARARKLIQAVSPQ